MSFAVPTWSVNISKKVEKTGIHTHTHTHKQTHRSPWSSPHIGNMLALMRADSSPLTHRQTQTGWHGASSSYKVGVCVHVCVCQLCPPKVCCWELSSML